MAAPAGPAPAALELQPRGRRCAPEELQGREALDVAPFLGGDGPQGAQRAQDGLTKEYALDDLGIPNILSGIIV